MLTLFLKCSFKGRLRTLEQAQTSYIASSTRGQTEEARRTTILQPVERKPHSQKGGQIERAEGYVPDEGTRKKPIKRTNEVEIGNLPEKELRIMIVKMIQDLGKRMEAKIENMQEMFNKDLEELKNKQTEMNNTITERNRTLEGIKQNN